MKQLVGSIASTFASNETLRNFHIVNKNTVNSTIFQHLSVQLTTPMKHTGSIAFVLTFASN